MGKITAVQAELCYEAGAYPGSPVHPGAMAMFAAYDIPNGQIDGYDVLVINQESLLIVPQEHHNRLSLVSK
ncbi:MAG: hypothetical protein CM1200mP6_02350 [Anaerolineaceae bacterium]|nr:MAG: hypothetical protein CM1200mP6_02350 [Anaerolineaceae bacterium]